MANESIPITVITCGVSETCKKAPDGKHDWSGEGVSFDGGLGWSATCKWCSVDAFTHDLWNGP